MECFKNIITFRYLLNKMTGILRWGVFWCLFFFVSDAAKDLSPVILVPGVGGSRLQAKLNKTSTVHFLCEKSTSDFFTIWFSLEFLVPIVNQCWLDNIRLVYDNISRTTEGPPGVDVRVPGFGDPCYVEWLDEKEHLVGYFKTLGNALVDFGYSRNLSLRGAPYDFRKGPSESGAFFRDLKRLVEETYAINGNRRIVFMAHSMGAPMVSIFLRLQNQSWKDKFVRGFVSLNGIFGGSVKAMKTYIMGDNLNEFFIPKSLLKELQIRSSSLPLLMPYKEIWGDSILASTPIKNYTMHNIRDFFVDIGFETGWEMRLDQLPYLNLEPPGVEVHCLHGVGVPTISKLIYSSVDDFPQHPNFEYGSGDGTVNLEGLDVCYRWRGLQKQKVYVHGFSNLDHTQILSDSRALDYVLTMLSKIPDPSENDSPRVDLWDESFE